MVLEITKTYEPPQGECESRGEKSVRPSSGVLDIISIPEEDPVKGKKIELIREAVACLVDVSQKPH